MTTETAPAFDVAGQHFAGFNLQVPQIPKLHGGGIVPGSRAGVSDRLANPISAFADAFRRQLAPLGQAA